MHHEPTISAPAYLDLYDLIKKRDIQVADDEIGLNRSELLNLEKRIPVSMENQLWLLAKKYGAPDHIGLIVGSQINEEAKGVVSHLVSYSQDLKEALNVFTKYIRLMSDNEKVEIIFLEGVCRIIFNDSYRVHTNLSSLERSMSALLTWGRYLTGKHIQPLQVCFQHEMPNYYSEYVKQFGDVCRFDCEKSYIDISESDLNLKVITANNYIKDVLIEHAEKLHSTIGLECYLLTKVKKIIEVRLVCGYFSSSDIAEKLNMSRQTLHRKLKEYNISFKVLLEDVRKEKALSYLKDNRIPLEGIGYKLGFKEPSAFFRAFKSWFNVTPGQFRKQSINKL